MALLAKHGAQQHDRIGCIPPFVQEIVVNDSFVVEIPRLNEHYTGHRELIPFVHQLDELGRISGSSDRLPSIDHSPESTKMAPCAISPPPTTAISSTRFRLQYTPGFNE